MMSNYASYCHLKNFLLFYSSELGLYSTSIRLFYSSIIYDLRPFFNLFPPIDTLISRISWMLSTYCWPLLIFGSPWPARRSAFSSLAWDRPLSPVAGTSSYCASKFAPRPPLVSLFFSFVRCQLCCELSTSFTICFWFHWRAPHPAS